MIGKSSRYEYEPLGVETLDCVNREILRLVNRMEVCLKENHAGRHAEFRVCLQKLLYGLEDLFRQEEAWMNASGFPPYAKQTKAQDTVLRELTKALDHLALPNGIHHRQIADFVRKWFINHQETTGSAYREHIKLNNLALPKVTVYEIEEFTFQAPVLRDHYPLRKRQE